MLLLQLQANGFLSTKLKIVRKNNLKFVSLTFKGINKISVISFCFFLLHMGHILQYNPCTIYTPFDRNITNIATQSSY